MDPLTQFQFEKQRFNNVVEELQIVIRELQTENKNLMNIIKHLK